MRLVLRLQKMGEGIFHIMKSATCNGQVLTSGNPVISHNQIVKGHSDGIVVGSSGKSVKFNNDLIGRGLFYCWAVFC